MSRLLDCTLRDGGYANDWNFGKDAIQSIKENLEKSGVEIIEMGFLKEVEYDPDRTLFPGVEYANVVVSPKKKGITYCLMVDAPVPYPVEKIAPRQEDGIDMIRIIMWKEKVEESIAYSQELIKKGYQVCIQPVRVNQYTYVEFIDLVCRFNSVGITAFYIVDSWGTQSKNEIAYYMELAERYINPQISLGYHGHNHKQQAISCAQELLKANENIILDCSIYGMGREAGNLNTELIMAHLNDEFETHYDIRPVLNSYSSHIKGYYEEFGWGYSMEHFLTALFNCHTKYINYITKNTSLSLDQIYDVFTQMTYKQKVEYSESLIKELIDATRT